MLFDRNNPQQYALFEKNILYPFLTDTYVESSFGKFTSNTSDGVIWNVSNKVSKGAGETVTFGMYQYTDAEEVYDDEQLEGRGEYNRPISESLRLGETRFAVRTEGQKLAELQTKINIDAQLQRDLHTKSQLLHTRRIVNQFAYCFDNATIRNGDNHKSYSYYIKDGGVNRFTQYFNDKILNCTIDHDENSISSDRIVVGNDTLGALQNTIVLSIADEQIGQNDPTHADSGNLTVRHIEKLVRVANNGGRLPNSEQIIKPYKTMKEFGFDNYNFVLFVSPSAASTLRQDPDWRNQVSRGVIEKKEQPSIFYNSAYLASIYNVDIIVIPEFEHLAVINADGSKVNYSALCGQSAIAMARGMQPMFTVENNDHKKKHELGVTMIDGMKPLKFLAKKQTNKLLNMPVEKGIIHSLTLNA